MGGGHRRSSCGGGLGQNARSPSVWQTSTRRRQGDSWGCESAARERGPGWGHRSSSTDQSFIRQNQRNATRDANTRVLLGTASAGEKGHRCRSHRSTGLH